MLCHLICVLQDTQHVIRLVICIDDLGNCSGCLYTYSTSTIDIVLLAQYCHFAYKEIGKPEVGKLVEHYTPRKRMDT